MPGLLTPLFDPAVWAGAGAAALAFVGGRVTKRDARISKLEEEVEECRKRDADVLILTAGVRLMVGEMKRRSPGSPALQMFGDLLNRRLGPPPSIDEFAELLKQIDQADEKHRDVGE